MSTQFHFLAHVLEHQVKDVRRLVYVRRSHLFQLYECLKLTVLSFGTYRAIIALPTAIVDSHIKTAENVLNYDAKSGRFGSCSVIKSTHSIATRIREVARNVLR